MKGTVKSKEDVERLFRKGGRSSSYLMTVRSFRTGQGGRMAFIAGKKLGSAPVRNRCKRVLRAVAYELGGPWEGYDIAFIAHGKTACASHESVVASMRKQLEGLHVL